MLARLSIRDIVLIERLDIEFSRGPRGADRRNRRGQIHPARCVRAGARRPRRCRPGAPRRGAGPGHRGVRCRRRAIRPRRSSATTGSTIRRGEMILRRVQLADGRTRAFINDQAISVQTLKAVGSALVEIHGQHDERALVDAVDPSPAARCLCRPREGCRRAGAALGRAARRQRACWTSIAQAWSAPRARRTICATPPMN